MFPLGENERRRLLRVARRAIEGAIKGAIKGAWKPGEAAEAEAEAETEIEKGTHNQLSGQFSEPADEPLDRQEVWGAFVTLSRGKELRGCIGGIETETPLEQTVAECAVAAATRDPRFSPVTADELSEISIEISLLSSPVELSLEKIEEKIEIGRHGLLVTQGTRRGLLLPQVAWRRGWDACRFLEQTCLKAGLDKSAWRRGAKVAAFPADVFEER